MQICSQVMICHVTDMSRLVLSCKFIGILYVIFAVRLSVNSAFSALALLLEY